MNAIANRDVAPKYAFLLLIAFEAGVRLGEWTTLSSIILV